MVKILSIISFTVFLSIILDVYTELSNLLLGSMLFSFISVGLYVLASDCYDKIKDNKNLKKIVFVAIFISMIFVVLFMSYKDNIFMLYIEQYILSAIFAIPLIFVVKSIWVMKIN